MGSSSTLAGKHVVVIGNGMVGFRFVQRLADLTQAEDTDITVFGEETHPAYDRVHLSSFFEDRKPESLYLTGPEWYRSNGVRLRAGERVTSIDTTHKRISTELESDISFDILVLATGSSCFIPPIPGNDKRGVLPYRTIEDLEQIADWADGKSRAAVLGGGLLGLEAAKAVLDLGLDVSVVELAPRLMPRQLDSQGADVLADHISDLGIDVLVNRKTASIRGNGKIEGIAFADGQELPTDLLVVSAGIRPRDELAREAGLAIGTRGGVAVDDRLRTSAESVFAIGEVASVEGQTYGLVAPGYQMAEVLAHNLCGEDQRFTGADTSTKLKLLGVDVASLGEPGVSGDDVDTITFRDQRAGIYRRINLRGDKLIGGILVGESDGYARLHHLLTSGEQVPEQPETLIVDGVLGGNLGGFELPDSAQVCSCESVSKGTICEAIRDSNLTTMAEVKAATGAGSGCGGCVPIVKGLLKEELRAAGRVISNDICEHFPLSRQALFEVIQVRRFRSFSEVLAEYGTGIGCEVCKPTVASVIASLWNDHVGDHATIQDTNDRFFANIQRDGSYSVIPRVPGGELTPEKLIVLGQVAQKYDLYTKITGGQRVAMFGARVEQLPEIWETLIEAGFESGHAYGKALRTVKSCVGTDWCRFGVGDSAGLAIKIENRYKGLRGPHKIKMAASGCIRECAEARSKDVGVIATENGWNLYVGGNGGAKPRHAELLASDLDEETLVRYIDRFLMYYIHTADKLTRTARWIEQLEGGLDHLREVIVDDSLGLVESLDAHMDRLVGTYQCEWTTVVDDPIKRMRFAHFANSADQDRTLRFVHKRGQRFPAPPPTQLPKSEKLERVGYAWVPVTRADLVPPDGGITVQVGDAQLAVFNVASKDEWYATQNACPHRRDMVLSRGLVGDEAGEAKVACPLHKMRYSLRSGACLSGSGSGLEVFEVKVEAGEVLILLPQQEDLERSFDLIGHSNSTGCKEARSI